MLTIIKALVLWHGVLVLAQVTIIQPAAETPISIVPFFINSSTTTSAFLPLRTFVVSDTSASEPAASTPETTDSFAAASTTENSDSSSTTDSAAAASLTESSDSSPTTESVSTTSPISTTLDSSTSAEVSISSISSDLSISTTASASIPTSSSPTISSTSSTSFTASTSSTTSTSSSVSSTTSQATTSSASQISSSTTSGSSASLTSTTNITSKTSLTTASYIGIAVGGAAALLLLALLIFCCIRKRKRQKRHTPTTEEYGSFLSTAKTQHELGAISPDFLPSSSNHPTLPLIPPIPALYRSTDSPPAYLGSEHEQQERRDTLEFWKTGLIPPTHFSFREPRTSRLLGLSSSLDLPPVQASPPMGTTEPRSRASALQAFSPEALFGSVPAPWSSSPSLPPAAIMTPTATPNALSIVLPPPLQPASGTEPPSTPKRILTVRNPSPVLPLSPLLPPTERLDNGGGGGEVGATGSSFGSGSGVEWQEEQEEQSALKERASVYRPYGAPAEAGELERARSGYRGIPASLRAGVGME